MILQGQNIVFETAAAQNLLQDRAAVLFLPSLYGVTSAKPAQDSDQQQIGSADVCGGSTPLIVKTMRPHRNHSAPSKQEKSATKQFQATRRRDLAASPTRQTL